MSVPAQGWGLGLYFLRTCFSMGLGAILNWQSAVCMALDGFAYRGNRSTPELVFEAMTSMLHVEAAIQSFSLFVL
jgi:hypothetical protein